MSPVNLGFSLAGFYSLFFSASITKIADLANRPLTPPPRAVKQEALPCLDTGESMKCGGQNPDPNLVRFSGNLFGLEIIPPIFPHTNWQNCGAGDRSPLPPPAGKLGGGGRGDQPLCNNKRPWTLSQWWAGVRPHPRLRPADPAG